MALLLELQFASRTGHSTETTVLKVLSDILCAVDKRDLSVLVLMDHIRHYCVALRRLTVSATLLLASSGHT